MPLSGLTRSPRHALAVTLLLFVITVTVTSVKLAETPYSWIFISLLLTCLLAATTCRHAIPMALWLNSGAVMAILLVVESYWTITNGTANTDVTIQYSHDYVTEHDVLGYAPVKDNIVTATKFYQDKLVYKVQYGIDKQGLRITSPSEPGASNCILFFGGSFTYGEGVNDNESLPYRVGVHSSGQYRIYNFAFHGYGPHQMLAALEQGLVDDSIQCKPKHIIYQGMVAHIMRSAGLTTWDVHGPRYRLNEAHKIEYTGHFDDTQIYHLTRLLRLDASQIYTRIFGTQRPIRHQDVELYVDIIARAKELFTSRYPGSIFHILLWGDTKNNNIFSQLLTLIREQEMNVYPRNEIMPLYEQNAYKYELSEHDHHPSALAHDLVAQYITTRLLGHM
ncbi:MAG: hypothetical protein PVG72_02980 [Gammaproteobacteria bacterium]|jgi:hypothetical protein